MLVPNEFGEILKVSGYRQIVYEPVGKQLNDCLGRLRTRTKSNQVIELRSFPYASRIIKNWDWECDDLPLTETEKLLYEDLISEDAEKRRDSIEKLGKLGTDDEVTLLKQIANGELHLHLRGRFGHRYAFGPHRNCPEQFWTVENQLTAISSLSETGRGLAISFLERLFLEDYVLGCQNDMTNMGGRSDEWTDGASHGPHLSGRLADLFYQRHHPRVTVFPHRFREISEGEILSTPEGCMIIKAQKRIKETRQQAIQTESNPEVHKLICIANGVSGTIPTWRRRHWFTLDTPIVKYSDFSFYTFDEQVEAIRQLSLSRNREVLEYLRLINTKGHGYSYHRDGDNYSPELCPYRYMGGELGDALISHNRTRASNDKVHSRHEEAKRILRDSLEKLTKYLVSN